MARRKKHEEHENHERWLVSYADFITLLFAFFVVMYSISSVNEGKYRVLSDTMVTAFKDKGSRIDPIQVGTPSKILNLLSGGVISPESTLKPEAAIRPIHNTLADSGKQGTNGSGSGSEHNEGIADKAAMQIALEAINKDIQAGMATLIDQNQMTLTKNKDVLEIELKSNILFTPGRARLSISAEKILIRLAKTLSKFPNAMQIEGHTDDRNVSSSRFPSNWELSSARASAVAHLFSEHGMDPEQMWAVGYAAYRPKVDNLSEEMRSQNRRVVLMVRPLLEEAKKKAEAEQTGPAVLNVTEPDPLLDVETDAAELNKAPPQPMLEDSGIVEEEIELNATQEPMLEINAELDEPRIMVGPEGVAGRETAEESLIAPIQLPFSTGTPIVRDVPVNGAGR